MLKKPASLDISTSHFSRRHAIAASAVAALALANPLHATAQTPVGAPNSGDFNGLVDIGGFFSDHDNGGVRIA